MPETARNNETKRKELIQATIERILYCDGYLDELEHLNEHYEPHQKVKYTDDISKFTFPLHEAIH